MTIEIHKFGGTSVGSAARIQAAAERIAERVRSGASPVAVSSAMSGITNALVALVDDPDVANLEPLRAHHAAAIAELGLGEPADGLLAAVNALLDDATDLVRAARVLGEMSPRSRDRLWATGEKLSVRLLAAALEAQGVVARAMDADTFLDTDGAFGSANPIGGVAENHVRAALLPLIEAGVVPVVTGFCGRGPDGSTTTLGRGGSDLSATLLAAALQAGEVTIWTDVPGVFSADPRAVPDARVIPHLNYREAAEMSYYGANVLHPRTMMPVARAGIPVVTRSSLEPDLAGTTVDARFTPGSHPVKAITAVSRQALVSVEGKGMAGVPGVAARVFGALAAEDVSVTMISQSSSEASISFAVDEANARVAQRALKRALVAELSRGEIEEIVVRPHVGLVAAVGLGMARTRGVAARAFAALAAEGINVLAIAQGSSELNLSLAIEAADVPAALRAMHTAFGLHRRDTGDDVERRLDLVLIGCGQIGRALLDHVLDDRASAFARLGLAPRVVAVADRSGFVLDPRGFAPEIVRSILADKAAGGRLASREGGVAGDAAAMLQAAFEWRLSRPVVIDVSDADGAEDVFAAAFRAGADVVTANKRPLAGGLEGFARLRDAAESARRLLRAEATVGAGLPIIDTLDVLVQTGDVVHEVEGSLSGTLGYLMGEVEDGVPLSEAVRKAVAGGYTEPDPAQDLSGADVARKATILARLAGLSTAVVQLEGLVPADWTGLPLEALLARLAAEVDAPLAARVERAQASGCVLRFVARITADEVTVGLQEVPSEAPLGRLRGTDNLVSFRTERYAAQPLVVIGPGAGVDVTAMGVLGDVLKVAAVRS